MGNSAIWVQLPFPETCAWCATSLPAGTVVVQQPDSGVIWCAACCSSPRPSAGSTPPAAQPIGVPGASAHREYERRQGSDEQRLRRKWGRLGNVAVALSEPRASTAAWERGSVGEQRLGARLNRLAGERVAVLHDRRIPYRTSNIDHLVVTTQRIWVIDAKRYKGRPERRVEGGLTRPRNERLFVAGRDRSQLVEGLLTQVDRVRQAASDLPITGALCFIDAHWPLFETLFKLRGIYVASPRRLTKLINKDRPGGIDPARTVARLAERFPAA